MHITYNSNAKIDIIKANILPIIRICKKINYCIICYN